MKKTLGGQRLGSGNKMTVDLHGFERSTHDLGYIWRSTMSAGTLVPFLKEIALPGDTFDIHLNCDIKTHPTVGPLFGSYKVQLDVFVTPIRLYNSALHNNRLGIGMNMGQIKFPKFELIANGASTTSTDFDNSQVNPSSIFAYLGIRGVGTVNPTDLGTQKTYRQFNAIPWLNYWEIYKNYYANKQEERGFVITKSLVFSSGQNVSAMNANGTPLGTVGSPVLVPFTYATTINATFTPGTTFDPDSIFVYFADAVYSYRELLIPGSLVVNTATGSAGGIYDVSRLGNQTSQYWTRITAAQITAAPPELVEFPLENIDLMRDAILQSPWNAEVNITEGGIGGPGVATPTPYIYALTAKQVSGSVWRGMQLENQEGLGIKTYQSDLFNNWLSTEWLDGTGGINEITAVDTSSGSFNIESLILSRKVYDMLNRIAVSGGSYNDWLEAVYDHEASNRAESPVYVGGLIKELTFQEVVSTGADPGGQPLGTLAGKGVMSGKHKGGTVVVKVDEPSYIIGIVSLTPRLDYSQGNKWDVHLDTMDDLHKPNLDQIGFQELITEQMAWWSTNKTPGVVTPGVNGTYVQKSAGKQPAWINYMTNVNQVLGNFAVQDNEMFMVLVRRYEPEFTSPGIASIKDLTTYVDPVKFNHIFADTALDAQNFWTQISVDITARRKMSAKVMPNL